MALTNGTFKGKGLSLTISGTEYNMDADSVVLDREDADSDFTSFASLNSGGAKQWFFTVNAAQDFATGSLWRYVWDNAGTDHVAFVFKPYGNATASATKPHFTGWLAIPAKPPIGGDADSVFTFEARFDVEGTPTMVTT